MMNALEKLGWKNATKNNYSQTYELGDDTIKITPSKVYKFNLFKQLKPFSPTEILALAEVIKEEEKK